MSQGLDAFRLALRAQRVVAMDTSACIYYLGGVEPWFSIIDSCMEDVLARRRELRVSAIVQLELLVGPIRSGDQGEAQRVLELTERRPNVHLVDIDRATVWLAASVRAQVGLKLADSIVTASAALSGCDALIGNDKRFRDIAGIGDAPHAMAARTVRFPQYIHLDDYIDAA